ncbi:MAG: LicD family protein [Magnetococcus sp. DMHC-6]
MALDQTKSAPPFILWTIQKSGGSYLAALLMERSVWQATQHEPFNIGHCFGDITERWQQEHHFPSLYASVGKIVKRSMLMKHCVDLVPWEVTRVLVEESCRAGYRHLFLYRKSSVDRLLSLLLARRSGIWGPLDLNKIKLDGQIFAESLPIEELVDHEKKCSALLQKTWDYLEAQGAAPMAVAYEEIFKTEDSKQLTSYLHPILSTLEISKGEEEDNSFIQKMTRQSGFGTSDIYSLFLERDKLELALKKETFFVPSIEKLFINVTSQPHECSWIVYTKLLTSKTILRNDQTFNISGVVVLTPEAPKKCTLRLVDPAKGGKTFKIIKWGLTSPWTAKKFQESKNGQKARFRMDRLCLSVNKSLEIYLDYGAHSKILLFRLTANSFSFSNKNEIGKFYTNLNKTAQQPTRKYSIYMKYRKELDAYPLWERGAVWEDASILVDCIFLRRARPTFKSIQALKQRCVKNRCEEIFDLLWSRVSTIISPYTLNGHGYNLALVNRNPVEVWGNISSYFNILSSLGYECFINSGTLLGPIRNGRLIGHDDDVDLGVVLKSETLLDVAKEWYQLVQKFDKLGILSETFDPEIANYMRIRHEGKAKVDIFPAWILQDKLYIYPHTNGELPREALLPLKPYENSGVHVLMPQNPEAILEINYGPGWRIPDPTFKFDLVVARIKFKEFNSVVTKVVKG